MNEQTAPQVEVQMLVRRPAAIVFEAFIDPAITTHFWFTKSSGKLEQGKKVIWEWEMYGASTEVTTKEIISNQKISIDWGKPATTVEFKFTAVTEQTTYVVIKQFGFKQTGTDLVNALKDSTGGFTTVLDGMKAYLEHNINLNLIADKFLKDDPINLK